MPVDMRAFLKDRKQIDSVPVIGPQLIKWKDPVTGELFQGYLIDTEACTEGELRAIYQYVCGRFPDVPRFGDWLQYVMTEGLPIREERVSALSFPLRSVI